MSEERGRARAPGTAALTDRPGLAVSDNREPWLAVIEALPEEHRDILHLVGVEGLKYEEVAVALEVPVGRARSRRSRASTSSRLSLEGDVVGAGHGKAGKVEAQGA